MKVNKLPNIQSRIKLKILQAESILGEAQRKEVTGEQPSVALFEATGSLYQSENGAVYGVATISLGEYHWLCYPDNDMRPVIVRIENPEDPKSYPEHLIWSAKSAHPIQGRTSMPDLLLHFTPGSYPNGHGWHTPAGTDTEMWHPPYGPCITMRINAMAKNAEVFFDNQSRFTEIELAGTESDPLLSISSNTLDDDIDSGESIQGVIAVLERFGCKYKFTQIEGEYE